LRKYIFKLSDFHPLAPFHFWLPVARLARSRL